LPRPHSATPSEVPQNELKCVVVPRLPNSIRCTEEGNHSKPHRTSHNLAHSVGLPKPPGYDLEWPLVTPIQVTLITRPPAKAPHQDTHPKLCRNPPLEPTLHQKPPDTPLTSLGKTWFQTAWRTSHTARRQTPSIASVALLPPGRTHTAAKRHAHAVATATVFGYLSPGGLPSAARRHTISAMLLVSGISNRSQGTPITHYAKITIFQTSCYV